MDDQNSCDILPEISYDVQFESGFGIDGGVSIIYLNIRSVIHRWALFEAFLRSMPFEPDIIVLVETWLYGDETQLYRP